MIPARKPRSAKPAAADWSGLTVCANVREIPVGQIEPDPTQPRREIDPDELAGLAATLKSRGQLQAIRVRELAEGRYRIVTGERRWRAAQQAGLYRVRCEVVDGHADPVETLLDQVLENTGRLDLSPLEQAAAFARILAAKGWSQGELARQIGVAQSTVAKRLALLKLPEEVRELIQPGPLDPSTAYELLGLDDVGDQVEAAQMAVDNGWSRSDVCRLVKMTPALRATVLAESVSLAEAVAAWTSPEPTESAEEPPPPPKPSTLSTHAVASDGPAAGATLGPPAARPGIGQAADVPGTRETPRDDRGPAIPGESPVEPIAPGRVLDALCNRIETEDESLAARGAAVRYARENLDSTHVKIAVGRVPHHAGEVTIGGGRGCPTVGEALQLALAEWRRHQQIAVPPIDQVPRLDYDPIRDEVPADVAQCTRCHRRRPLVCHPCPACLCPEFAVAEGGSQ